MRHMIKGIAVAYLHSPNGERLADWYSKTLGLTISASYPEWKEFQMQQGSRFAIDVTSFPRSVVEKQPIMLSFEVEDIHAAVRDLASKGVRFYPSTEKTIFEAGPSLVCTFHDPDGNWMQLSQRKHDASR
jgi:uncharacterized glyoxalase superfamily protein PhnB